MIISPVRKLIMTIAMMLSVLALHFMRMSKRTSTNSNFSSMICGHRGSRLFQTKSDPSGTPLSTVHRPTSICSIRNRALLTCRTGSQIQFSNARLESILRLS